MRPKRIMVVDDEDSIRTTLAGVLRDEGFDVVLASTGQEALKGLAIHPPDLILLDIWMPDIDGIEMLKEIKGKCPDIQVIMISGHGNIETAVKATKLGATDYIEKPLSLEGLLLTVRRTLNGEEMETRGRKWTIEGGIHETRGPLKSRGERKEGDGLQRTIKRSIVLGGQGLHSGMKTGLILSPLPPNSGIVFTGLSSEERVPAHLGHVYSTDYATTVKSGHTSVMTIEHLMAVLHMYRITNLLIKTGGEIPIMDGSAKGFCEMIEDGGIEEQDEPLEEIKVDGHYFVGDANRYISIEPSSNFTIHYSLDCPSPIGKEEVQFTLDSPEVFKREIAPARTYGFVKDYGRLEEMGLAKGGRLSNVILLDDEKVINTVLRFPDEFVRHKVLDMIGDLYLLGRPIRGKVFARMTGHTENIALLRKIARCEKG